MTTTDPTLAMKARAFHDSGADVLELLDSIMTFARRVTPETWQDFDTAVSNLLDGFTRTDRECYGS